MPDSAHRFVNRRGKAHGIAQNQLAHVLPAYADQVGNISDADKIRGGLDELCRGDGLLYIGKGADDSGFGAGRIAREFKGDAARLAQTNKCIVTASLTQSKKTRTVRSTTRARCTA